jgi:hypothetical protein
MKGFISLFVYLMLVTSALAEERCFEWTLNEPDENPYIDTVEYRIYEDYSTKVFATMAYDVDIVCVEGQWLEPHEYWIVAVNEYGGESLPSVRVLVESSVYLTIPQDETVNQVPAAVTVFLLVL